MADKTALQESSQALFCAISDYLGLDQTKKIFNLDVIIVDIKINLLVFNQFSIFVFS